MPSQIISGGQSGVDRAALDAAREMGVPVGGWCPKGRRAEDGAIAACYPLDETPSDQYAQRTEWNIRDSDGTLVLTFGPPTGGTALTVRLADRLGKRCLVLDLKNSASTEDALSWIGEHRIQVLNVAGPRASCDSAVYPLAFDFVARLLDHASVENGSKSADPA
jgi:hypothetical protein